MPAEREIRHGISPSSRLALVLAGVHLLFAALVITGWAYDIPLLRGAWFGTFVAPNAALLFLMAGVAVLAYRCLRPAGLGEWCGRIAGMAIALLAAVLIAQRFVSADLHVDRFFLGSKLIFWSLTTPPGRVAAPTAVAFLLVGIALALLDSRRAYVVDVCASGIFAVGYLAVLGYLYGLRPFYGYWMALATAVMLIVSATMLLAAAKHSWLRSVALSRDAGGIVIRRLAPLFFVLMPLMGWGRLRAERIGWIPHEFATALFAASSVLVFGVVGLLVASHLNRLDVQRKRAQAALIQTEKLATAGRLAATVAHEINNPLEAALNSVYLARGAGVNDVAEKYLAIAERELQRVAAVARRSLGFFRAQEGADVNDLAQELREVIELVRPQADVKGVALEVNASDGLSVVAAPGDLRQIFSNLVVNALNATNRGGRVLVHAAAANDDVRAAVSDTGQGIPADVCERIFEPFFTTNTKTGVGLGLFVVQELVTKNGGTVRCQSSTRAEDHGTTFTITLPRAHAHKAAAAS